MLELIIETRGAEDSAREKLSSAGIHHENSPDMCVNVIVVKNPANKPQVEEILNGAGIEFQWAEDE